MFSNGLTTGVLAVMLAGCQLAAAHMWVSNPPPFRSKNNPNANPAQIDYSITAPLAADGSNYPCKGYHSDFGTAAGKSVATYAPGQAYEFTLEGGAPHGGGSCQVSLSYDQGKTFTVIQSLVGGCGFAANYKFTIPDDAPQGEAIWAWTWNNNIGNRELYMNCAAVTIGPGSAKRDVEEERNLTQRATAAFSSRPQVFLANINNGCTTTEGSDVQYPNPGPDVVTGGSKLAPPVGNCGAGAGAGAGVGTGSGSGSGSGSSSSSAVQATVAPTSTVAPAPSSSAAASNTGLPGGVFITVPGSSASASASATATPTTLVTATSSALPAATPGTGSGTGSGSSSGSGSATGGYPAGTACTSEGAWNCIGGTSFQRCASGTWSPVQAVAAGTTCKAGESATLSVEAAASKKLRRRFRGSAKLILA
ncbi:lytic polysaccharide monooxygenase [Parathielavia appendiculata]|uniref:Lytic polysaccharide monooxygenase n=1 Tax=Parathielavia appendiculata TaxID=2587402 RepID=A0AAN6Z1U2_9PEZI|nr:lytic polysaccharide monooxygenase [Parathielavia appendiculata]